MLSALTLDPFHNIRHAHIDIYAIELLHEATDGHESCHCADVALLAVDQSFIATGTIVQVEADYALDDLCIPSHLISVPGYESPPARVVD